MTTILRTFTTANPTISKDLAGVGDAWLVNCTHAQTFRLFEVADPGVEECKVLYRAKLKTEELTGRAYLEMWCKFPGGGNFFSKGIKQSITGSNDWISCEIPFLLRKGEKPDLILLNLAIESAGWLWKKSIAGKVWIKEIELLKATLS